MSFVYDQYLAEHIGNVNKGLHWMLDNLGLGRKEKATLEVALANFDHDDSKYSVEEYDAYDKYFYGGNRSYKVVQDFNYAWLHHIHQNPHHWQYWVLLEDDPESGLPYKALEIPVPYIFEMIADWWSFSWKSGNLFEIFNWYADHRSKQIINPKSREIVEYILDRIWKVLITQETVAGHDISEIEKQYKRFWAEQDDIRPAFGKLEYNPDDEDSYRETADNAAVTAYGNDVEFYGLQHSDSEPIGKVLSTRETENGLEVTVEYSKDNQGFWKHLIENRENDLKHSDEEDDEDLYGVPELKKFPMPDKKHVKSAIRFFNYVDPKYEKELAEAIIEKAEEFGLDLKKDIKIGDENMFKKYIVADDDESKNEDRVLTHYGIKGQTWGERRFQYADGSLTPEGRKRYLKESKMDPSNKKDDKKSEPLFDISKLGKGTNTPPGAPGPNGRVGTATGSEEPKYDQWEKDLYAEFEKSGMNPANMSDAEFKALLVKRGVLKEDAADSLVATMRQKAMKNYKIYSKKDEPAATTETAPVTTDSDSDKKSRRGSGESSGSGSGAKKANADTKPAEESEKKKEPEEKEQEKTEETSTNKPQTISEIEDKIYEKLDKKGVDSIIEKTGDELKKSLEEMTGFDLSDLTEQHLEYFKNRIQNHYLLENWEKKFKEDMNDILDKHPRALNNDQAFAKVLDNKLKVNTEVLDLEEVKKMRSKFVKMYLDSFKKEDS